MNCVPPLPVHNRFDCLEEEYISVADTPLKPNPVTHPSRPPSRTRIPKWEKRLPEKYIRAATPGLNSLSLKVEIQTTDTAEVKALSALLDCGATGLFIDAEYVHKHCLTTRKLSQPIPVYNVDGSANEAGSISEIVDLILRYQNHSERAQFAVTSLG